MAMTTMNLEENQVGQRGQSGGHFSLVVSTAGESSPIAFSLGRLV